MKTLQMILQKRPYFVLIGILFLNGCESDHGSHPKTKETVLISAPDLYNLYNKNEVAADDKLKDKTVKIDGTVASIDEGLGSKMSISLSDDSYGIRGVNVHPYDAQRGIVSLLLKGDYLGADCNNAMKILGTPSLSDCEIVFAYQDIADRAFGGEFLINKVFSNYNGKTFDSDFIIAANGKTKNVIRAEATFSCQPNTIDISIGNIKGHFSGKNFDEAEFSKKNPTQNSAQKKAIEGLDKWKKTFLTEILKKDKKLSSNVADFIHNVCALKES